MFYSRLALVLPGTALMGHMAIWKTLEDMAIELRKKGVNVSPSIIADLRSAKSMILLSENEEGSRGEAMAKVEEILGSIEANLVTSAQNALGSDVVDAWLRRLETASCDTCNIAVSPEESQAENEKFITGVPRDQKWIRVEPTESLPVARIEQIAKEQNLTIKPENGKLIVYGQPDNIKVLVKKMALEVAKK